MDTQAISYCEVKTYRVYVQMTYVVYPSVIRDHRTMINLYFQPHQGGVRRHGRSGEGRAGHWSGHRLPAGRVDSDGHLQRLRESARRSESLRVGSRVSAQTR